MLVLGDLSGIQTYLLDVVRRGIQLAVAKSPLAHEPKLGEPCQQHVCPISTRLNRIIKRLDTRRPDTPWRARLSTQLSQVIQQPPRND